MGVLHGWLRQTPPRNQTVLQRVKCLMPKQNSSLPVFVLLASAWAEQVQCFTLSGCEVPVACSLAINGGVAVFIFFLSLWSLLSPFEFLGWYSVSV